MKKIISLLIILLVCFSTSILAKQQVDNINLEYAIKLALENNNKLKQAKINYEQQKINLELYKKMYNNNLGFGVESGYNLVEQEEDEGEVSPFGREKSEATYLEIEKKFSEDSSLVLTQELLEKDSDDNFELEGSGGALAYNHYFLREYGGVNDYDYGLIKEELALLEAKKEVDDLRKELKAEIVDKYYNLIKLQKKLEIREEMLKESSLTLEVAKAKVKAGEALKLEQKEAELQVEENKLALEELSSQYRMAIVVLEEKLKTKLNKKVQLFGANKVLEFDKTAKEVKELAYDNNLEVALLKKRIKQKEYNIKKLKNKKALDLKLVGEVAWQRDGEPKTDYRVGMELDYDFNFYQNKVDEEELNKEEINLDGLEKELEDKKEELNLEVEHLLFKLKEYQGRIAFYKKAIQNAEKRLEIARLKYKSGLIIVSDLFNKQLNLMEKKIDYINNLSFYNKQVHKIKRIVN